MRLCTPRPKAGFSIIELLIVIGVIALLLAILLPTFGRVRETARRVTCMSNLRQLGQAATAYLQENGGSFPTSSPRSPNALRTSDWIYWRSSAVYTADVQRSPLAKYAGSTSFASLLRCPSDDARRTNMWGADPPYEYSYTMNIWLAGYQFNNARTTNLAQIKNPATKILFAEEDERSLNDGGFWHAFAPSASCDWLSIRHDRQRVLPDTFQAANMDRRGHISFCDGHAEYVDRAFASKLENFDPAK